jgi:hypothetical protein
VRRRVRGGKAGRIASGGRAHECDVHAGVSKRAQRFLFPGLPAPSSGIDHE